MCRSRLLNYVQPWLLDTQVGGKEGGGTDLASHTFRSFMAWAALKKRNMLAIFVDQASAFYRTIRSLVVKGGPSDEAVPWIIGQLGFDDTQIRDLAQSLLEDSALEQAKVPIQFQDVIAGMCAGAHFHTKGVKNFSIDTQRYTTRPFH